MSRRDLALATLFVVPLAGVCVAAWQVFQGRVGLPELVVCAGFLAVVNIGVFVGSHRLFAHRSFEASRGLRAALAIAGSMAGQGPVLWWASNHRLHHVFADDAGDVHSPREPGSGRVTPGRFWFAHYGWLAAQAEAIVAVVRAPDAQRTGVLARHWRYAPDLFQCPVLRWVNRWHFVFNAAGLCAPAALLFLWYGDARGAFQGFLWGGLVRNAVNHHGTFLVNSLCHCAGRRAFRCGDTSGNVAWLLPFTWGENWHNNHHAFPASARHGLLRGQWDPNHAFIRLCERLGWAWGVRLPSPVDLASRALPGAAERLGAPASPMASEGNG